MEYAVTIGKRLTKQAMFGTIYNVFYQLEPKGK